MYVMLAVKDINYKYIIVEMVVPDTDKVKANIEKNNDFDFV